MAHTWIPVIVAIVLLSIHGVESVKGKDNALPADWSRDVCYPNTFKSMINFYIRLNERWKDPKVKKRDKRRITIERRSFMLQGMMDRYCNDENYNETQVLAMDKCFSIAFGIDLDITVACRRHNFYTTEQVKMSDCSDADTREGVAFRECANDKMKERKPDFDMFDHKTTPEARELAEFKKYLKKPALRCIQEVLDNYYRAWAYEEFDPE